MSTIPVRTGVQPRVVTADPEQQGGGLHAVSVPDADVGQVGGVRGGREGGAPTMATPGATRPHHPIYPPSPHSASSETKRGQRRRRGAAGHEGEPLIYQQRGNLFAAGQKHFVWGLWMVGDECRGLSARGDTSLVTGNLSQFFPHRIEG